MRGKGRRQPSRIARLIAAPALAAALTALLVPAASAFELFGFASLEDRETFRLLLGITKLGPRTALAILACFSTDDLARLVATGDMEALTRVPGIGKKSAQRIFIELTYKLEGRSAAVAPLAAPAGPGGGVLADVVAGLTNLGYADADARRVAGATLEAEPDLDVAAALRQALKRLASEKS